MSDAHFRRGLSCAGCHGGQPDDDDMADEIYDRWPDDRHENRTWIPGFCARCHADPVFMRGFDPALPTDQLAKYETSRHGMLLLGEHDSKAAQCVSCHGVHGIRSAKSPKSKVHPQQVPGTCGHCHADAAYMAGYRSHTGQSLPVTQLEEYRKSVHGRALLENGDIGAPACNDCHGNHAALPPESASVAQVCRNCHAHQGELFDGSKHKTAFEREGWPECTQCHDNHAIRVASDSMLDEATSSLCYECHADYARENSECTETARYFHRSITDLAEEERFLAAEMSDLAESGLDPDPLGAQVDELYDALHEARASIHAFDRGEFDVVLARGRAAGVEGRKRLAEAEAEYRFRTRGLAVALGTMALLGAVLALKIRQAERREP